ncbi:sigma-70 family RNA polymerase sigma factor (plasmid) [Skermanella rosea]|uniref:sigma-70 family RNA polymerase sigma factor n=1 Tax=Skermanella rosea TaxID=1817965 RepID=UPI001931DF35|nr:sigma-70 family RNA polymerase sigma factor [Skermanella rosea]UEM07701.1 sigma-70 family RNA polymerase sigma factor [Skermanella rosea]
MSVRTTVPDEPSAGRDAPTPPDQGRLLAAVARGDRAAFGALFHHFAPRVKAQLIRAGAKAEVADEIAQDVMLAVWRRAGEYDPGRASPAAWIFTIARNRRIDVMRRERRPEMDPNDPELRPAETEDAEAALSRMQMNARLRGAVGALPKEQEEALVATLFSDRSYGDYAQASGLPLGTVKSRLRLAFARLRSELKEAL